MPKLLTSDSQNYWVKMTQVMSRPSLKAQPVTLIQSNAFNRPSKSSYTVESAFNHTFEVVVITTILVLKWRPCAGTARPSYYPQKVTFTASEWFCWSYSQDDHPSTELSGKMQSQTFVTGLVSCLSLPKLISMFFSSCRNVFISIP